MFLGLHVLQTEMCTQIYEINETYFASNEKSSHYDVQATIILSGIFFQTWRNWYSHIICILNSIIFLLYQHARQEISSSVKCIQCDYWNSPNISGNVMLHNCYSIRKLTIIFFRFICIHSQWKTNKNIALIHTIQTFSLNTFYLLKKCPDCMYQGHIFHKSTDPKEYDVKFAVTQDSNYSKVNSLFYNHLCHSADCTIRNVWKKTRPVGISI